MTAEEEYQARLDAEDSEELLLLLLLQIKVVTTFISRGEPYLIDMVAIKDELVKAGYAGAKVIIDNAKTPKEIVQLLSRSGYIEQAAAVASDQMEQTTIKRINSALDQLAVDNGAIAVTDQQKALAVKAELEAIAESRASVAVGNMVVDGAEGLKDLIVNRGTKTWINMGDRRVRLTHMAAGGQTVPANDYFTVGGSRLKFPRDPAGSAKETARCRCVARYSEVW